MIRERAKSLTNGGKVRDSEQPARMDISRNWSGVRARSASIRALSTKVKEPVQSIDVMTLSIGHKRASVEE